jgi:glycosyltransferase involved in cell wall biosynthesis
MKTFISLCMIVKNEENVLSRCLDSIHGLVDEIIIIDTGSEDDTKKIASLYTDKVFDFEWKENFSDARNYAASFAEGKWILVLDADEYIERENFARALNELRQNKDNYEIFAVNIVNFSGEYGESIAQHQHSRIYKNNANIEFHRAIHEQLNYTNKNKMKVIGMSPLIIYHSGYLNKTIREKEKNKRNQGLIEKEINEKTSEGFDLFNLANEFRILGQIQKATDFYIKAYQRKEEFWQNWVPFCICNLVECLIELERFEDALKIICDAEKVYGNTVDFIYLKGHIYLIQNRYEDAKVVFEHIYLNSSKYTGVIKSSDFKDYLPHRRLGYIYEKEGDLDKAITHYVNALNYNGHCEEALISLIKILQKSHTREEVFTFIQEKFLFNKNKLYISKVTLKLLNIGNVHFAKLLLDEYFEEDNFMQRFCGFKMQIINNEYEKCSYNIDSNSLLSAVKQNIIDAGDLLIYLIDNDDKDENVQKTYVQALVLSSNLADLYKLLFNILEDNIQIETDLFLTMVKKCIDYSNYNVIEKLIKIMIFNKKHFVSNINIKMANLLYKSKLIDNAVFLYDEVNENHLLDNEAINNIIEYLFCKGSYNDALSYVFYSIESNNDDFRVFKTGLSILESMNELEDKEKFIIMGLEKFPDSHWLRNEYLTN